MVNIGLWVSIGMEDPPVLAGFFHGKSHLEMDDDFGVPPLTQESSMYYWLVVTGCHEFYFPILIGNFIIPIDFHILQRGSKHQPDYWDSDVSIHWNNSWVYKPTYDPEGSHCSCLPRGFNIICMILEKLDMGY